MSLEKYRKCIDACLECVKECKYCIGECLEGLNPDDMAKLMKLETNCAAISLLSIEFMSSDSQFVNPLCTLCAEVCIDCAVECEKYMHLQHCERCAIVCRKCAEEWNKVQLKEAA